jgi:hypothetical protein
LEAALKFELAVAFVLLALTGRAQSPGAFTATGSMITPRFFHTATLLPDGRILIAGGDGSYSPTTNADPATGTFVATGSMTTPRDGHTATLLPNGTVLIAGGGPRINGGGYSLTES